MKYIIGLLFLFLSCVSVNATTKPESVLFYYDNRPLSDDIFYAFDWIVLDMDNSYLDVLKDKFYMQNKAKLIGYISIGEIEKYRQYFNDLKKFAIGENPMWDSLVADLRNKDYTDFLINVIAKKISEKGFDGFFLDTLDSYQLVAKKEEWIEFQKAEIELIKNLKQKFPDKLIILNRGFEIIDNIYLDVDGVAVESLFYGLDNNRRYIQVGEEERGFLLKQLQKIKTYGLPVIVIDYLDPKETNKASYVVQKISELGFIPYIADKQLSKIGYSKFQIIPRKVVLLYNSSSAPLRQIADIHRLIQMPLEYLGFIPELYDVNQELPEVSLNSGYAGVVSMNLDIRSEKIESWLLQAKDAGLKIFFINDIPFREDSSALAEFGINLIKNKDKKGSKFKMVQKMAGDGFEAPLLIPYTDSLLTVLKGQAVVKLENSSEQSYIPFALTEWGGYAINASFINDAELWVYNPFKIFEQVFKREQFPIPDTTTENGRRILTAHIDGEGFYGNVEFNPLKTTGEVIRDEILKAFPIPHSVSIIEAEVAPWGLYPEKSQKLEQVAKSIFELTNVEPASHSFSHPFIWQFNLTAQFQPKELYYGHNLSIKGYQLNFEREVAGSINYINSLLKDSKKRVKLFLWTGDCNPDEEQIRLTYKSRVFNVNGGNTVITQQEPFLSGIAPMGVNYASYFQIYTPVQNENIFTNLWKGPFWGYINVIQTFELTEKPVRLKPISIYYHYYSGSKQASLNALKKVYNYVISQRINPVFLSEYAEKVLDFRQTVILKDAKSLRVKNAGYLRTLRIPAEFGFPDIKESKGIVGFFTDSDNTYLHLDGSGDYIIKFSKEKPKNFYLISSNGQVESFIKQENTYILKLKAYVLLQLQFEKGRCEVFMKKEEKYAEIKAICPD